MLMLHVHPVDALKLELTDQFPF